MRLAEMLSYADIEQLHQLANTYSCSCNVNSKNELIQSLLSSIKKESMIVSQLEELKPEEFHFLMHLVFDARTTFSLEDLRAKAKFSFLEDLDRDTYRSLISVALKKGWIFRVLSRHAGASFQVPMDMKKQWSHAILNKELKGFNEHVEPSVYRDEGQALVDDVQVFLKYLMNHDTPLTGEGVIYKRNQQQIMELLAVNEELIGKGGWRFGYGRHFRDYPDRFSLLYDFCFYRGYINEQQGSALSITPLAEEAFQLPGELLGLEMYKFWVRVYKRPIPGLPMLTRMVCTAVTSRWLSERSLADLLQSRVRKFYYDDQENIIEQRILKMMVHLGLLRKGKLSEEDWGYQTTSWGSYVMEKVETSAMKAIVLDKKK
ncbi:hypothetical protein [Ammoniphilus resinae]|uniref:Uncharacterized protein n=1 Tax=Ammoniphilus resinae TaxID=861532 RepID=A0ABS4GT15_9BACL|nr:hypothetical protein [Ammoniphilus resinae]MBP1933425.1 hypothetical protein [Ammoniphilus resinae]